LEAVGKGTLDPNDEEAFRDEWEARVEAEEGEMQSSWLHSRFVPLAESVPLLEVLYHQTKHRAKELHEKKEKSKGMGEARTEEWVEAPHGGAGGFVDRVIETWEGPILQDYKSGALSPPEREEEDAIKESYKVQMKLYAALYHEKHGRWPRSLQLVALDDTVRTVDYTIEGARELLEEACEMLRDVNQMVSDIRENYASHSTLADPAPEKCQACGYRPGCQAYWGARDDSDAESWPTDVRGRVLSRETDSGGRFVLRVSSTPGGDEISLHAILPEMIEEGKAKDLTEGAHVGAYNLYPQSENAYKATQHTAIYYQRRE
jgi:CRISPR/Cas system-associated exonuclease Cas4 (RecB family)